jgi:FtsP/CotA-like multicopper oxidase with cupredoxin domain
LRLARGLRQPNKAESERQPSFVRQQIDFIADDPGPSLLHCHHQDHQDEGFMGMMIYL